MNEIIFLRHGATAGNLERRYIGRTDEPLCAIGRAQAMAARGLDADFVFTSPARRTKETAQLAFPGCAHIEIPDLWETDFGTFEGKTADELAEDPDYRAWVDGFCKDPCPGGEAMEGFKDRCCHGFLMAMASVPAGKRVAFVIHGGCIMAIMERFAMPKREFYAYHIGNGEWITCRWDGRRLKAVDS